MALIMSTTTPEITPTNDARKMMLVSRARTSARSRRGISTWGRKKVVGMLGLTRCAGGAQLSLQDAHRLVGSYYRRDLPGRDQRRWQETQWPGVTSRNAGTSARQRASA